jgi:threonine dehydrogenase-like Zn-dependent dehydrogenase
VLAGQGGPCGHQVGRCALEDDLAALVAGTGPEVDDPVGPGVVLDDDDRLAGIDQAVTITTGLVDTYPTPTRLRLVASHQIEASRFATHHFDLQDMLGAYDVYQRAAETGAVKVVLTR